MARGRAPAPKAMNSATLPPVSPAQSLEAAQKSAKIVQAQTKALASLLQFPRQLFMLVDHPYFPDAVHRRIPLDRHAAEIAALGHPLARVVPAVPLDVVGA